MTKDEKNIKAIVEAGEIDGLTAREYMSRLGKKGGKNRWKGKTKKERSEYMSWIAKRPRKKKPVDN